MTQTVGQRIRALRKSAGSPTQKEAAHGVGCSERSYQNWEQEEVVPSRTNALRLARYYRTSPEYILLGIHGPHSPIDTAGIEERLDRIIILLEALPQDGGGGATLTAALREALAPLPLAQPAARRSQRSARGRDRRVAAQAPAL